MPGHWLGPFPYTTSLPGIVEVDLFVGLTDNLKENLAKGNQILAVPTLVGKLPQPVRKIVGDLSPVLWVPVGLDLRPAG